MTYVPFVFLSLMQHSFAPFCIFLATMHKFWFLVFYLRFLVWFKTNFLLFILWNLQIMWYVALITFDAKKDQKLSKCALKTCDKWLTHIFFYVSPLNNPKNPCCNVSQSEIFAVCVCVSEIESTNTTYFGFFYMQTFPHFLSVILLTGSWKFVCVFTSFWLTGLQNDCGLNILVN